MKSEPKRVNRKPKRESRKKAVPRTKQVSRHSQPEGPLSDRKKEFARRVWPRISASTKFVDLPESQTVVDYTLPSGKVFSATLKWYTFTLGPRIFAHYDDENDVCYIGKFVEQT